MVACNTKVLFFSNGHVTKYIFKTVRILLLGTKSFYDVTFYFVIFILLQRVSLLFLFSRFLKFCPHEFYAILTVMSYYKIHNYTKYIPRSRWLVR